MCSIISQTVVHRSESQSDSLQRPEVAVKSGPVRTTRLPEMLKGPDRDRIFLPPLLHYGFRIGDELSKVVADRHRAAGYKPRVPPTPPGKSEPIYELNVGTDPNSGLFDATERFELELKPWNQAVILDHVRSSI